ncbi:winged-helix domain-containing protein [Halolamina sp. C58]|uniref:winged-helix domain-containing protein n=1 Tax=Halolamina sp. C58 TaxID=3421640 RepID=UPI003EBC8725
MLELIALYNVLTGFLAGAGILYLLSTQDIVRRHQRFVVPLLSGIFLYVTVSPVINFVTPHLTHLVHIFAGLLVIWGLYSPLHNDLRTNQWSALLFRDPASARHPKEWMRPMDDEILQVFHSTQLILSPSIIARNIQRNRDEVNRRLRTLEDHGFVSRVDRGQYRLTQYGERYLYGNVSETLSLRKNTKSDIIE